MGDILGPHITATDVKIREHEMFLRMELWGKKLQEQLINDLFDLVAPYAEKKTIPEVSLKEAMVMAAIATAIKNPETTRRHLFNIFRM